MTVFLMTQEEREAMERVAGTFGRMVAFPVEDNTYRHLVVYSPRSDYWRIMRGFSRVEVARRQPRVSIAASSTGAPIQAERLVNTFALTVVGLVAATMVITSLGASVTTALILWAFLAPEGQSVVEFSVLVIHKFPG